jgi:hypothetical protein
MEFNSDITCILYRLQQLRTVSLVKNVFSLAVTGFLDSGATFSFLDLNFKF